MSVIIFQPFTYIADALESDGRADGYNIYDTFCYYQT